MANTDAVHVDPTNMDQLRAWDGDEGAYWAAHADRFDRGIAGHHRRFMDAADIDRRDRALDVGCGTGQTTRDAARRAPEGFALGVDLSAAMLEVARRRAAEDALTNVGFEQADAQVHQFERGGFDVALGRTSAMFFGDRVAALANVGRALRPDGRLVLLTWQPLARNEWIQAFVSALAVGGAAPSPPSGAPGPFTLAEPNEIRAVLGAAGYTDVRLEDVREPMWFGADGEDATQFVLGLLGWMLTGLDDADQAAAVDALRRSTTAHVDAAGVHYDSAAWIIRATRA